MASTDHEPVSVIIPYSPEHTPERMVEEAKRSIEAQAVPTELVVVEDPEQRGPAATRNEGLVRAETRYVAFLDADDRWRPNKLERQLKRMEETGAGLCLDGPSMTRDDFIYELYVGDLNVVMSSILIDTEQVDVRFEERLERWEDHLFALEASSAGVCFCRDTFTVGDSESSVTARGIDTDTYLEQGKTFDSLVFDRVPEARPFLSISYRRLYCAAALYEHRASNYRAAMKYALRSLRISPSLYGLIALIGSVVFYLVFDFFLDTWR